MAAHQATHPSSSCMSRTSSIFPNEEHNSVTVPAASFFLPNLCMAVASSAVACLLPGMIFNTSVAQSMALWKALCPSSSTVRCSKHLARRAATPSSATGVTTRGEL
eukprot:scaffold223321_cov32-Tisochrysis_lutea.AAC.2